MSRHYVVGRLQPLHRKPPQPSRKFNLLSARVFASTALVAFASSVAVAADTPVKPPAAPVAHDWTGCYVGVNGGGGVSGSSFKSSVDPGTYLSNPGDLATASTAGTGSANDSNFLGGGQAGCNWQSGTLVFGLEGDVGYFHGNPGFVNRTGTLSDGTTFSITQSLATDFFATVRPRIGIAADRNLAYVPGGVAFTDASYAQTYVDAAAPAGTGRASGSNSLVGWTAGAGWEYAWTDHWTSKIEYLCMAFPTTNGAGAIADSAGGSNPFRGSADLVIQTARAGLNYKF
jgi:outer membrane immunogenic protein